MNKEEQSKDEKHQTSNIKDHHQKKQVDLTQLQQMKTKYDKDDLTKNEQNTDTATQGRNGSIL